MGTLAQAPHTLQHHDYTINTERNALLGIITATGNFTETCLLAVQVLLSYYIPL